MNEKQPLYSLTGRFFFFSWLFGISVNQWKYSAVIMCSLKIFRGSKLDIIFLAVSIAGTLGRQWMITVYYYVKMCLGPLEKTESCCYFPSALGLEY